MRLSCRVPLPTVDVNWFQYSAVVYIFRVGLQVCLVVLLQQPGALWSCRVLVLHISRSSAVIENDQCISSHTLITDNLRPIINLVLEWSQDKLVLIIFSKTIICTVADDWWTENNVIKISGGGA